MFRVTPEVVVPLVRLASPVSEDRMVTLVSPVVKVKLVNAGQMALQENKANREQMVIGFSGDVIVM